MNFTCLSHCIYDYLLTWPVKCVVFTFLMCPFAKCPSPLLGWNKDSSLYHSMSFPWLGRAWCVSQCYGFHKTSFSICRWYWHITFCTVFTYILYMFVALFGSLWTVQCTHTNKDPLIYAATSSHTDVF
jgi:hypothetical protein